MLTVWVKDFADWRNKARILLTQQINPDQIEWTEASTTQASLFATPLTDVLATDITLLPALSIPRAFIQLAENIACHRSGVKWSLLYLTLWRLTHGEKYLLQVSTDPLIDKIMLMYKAVRRDMHKMKAFVRFKLYTHDDKSFYIAWHKPDHKILKAVCGFFKRRFQVMQWLIVTPDGAAYWDGERLQFDESIVALKEPLLDEVEDLWLTYYRSIFNPARIKLKAMRREMPVRYWETMPETRIITEILLEAPQRVAAMIKQSEGLATSATDYLPADISLASLKAAAANCAGCPLHRPATQTVFGTGAPFASLMLVGEQPGDQEDLSGLPFCGPAGQLLHKILAQADIDVENIYITNAVKHFKYTLTNHKRIHVSPHIREVNACKPWLMAEIAAVQPQIIICLGLTAARSLINPGFHMKQQRGNYFEFSATQKIVATYHPSAILRAVDETQQQVIYDHLLTDLKNAKSMLNN